MWGSKPCGPGQDFRIRKGHWHCVSCHQTFKRKERQTTCRCGSEEIFNTADGNWPGQKKEESDAQFG